MAKRRHLAWIVLDIRDYGGDVFQAAFRTKKLAQHYLDEHPTFSHHWGIHCWDLDTGAECGYED